jgi:hypothetical protein
MNDARLLVLAVLVFLELMAFAAGVLVGVSIRRD